MHGAFNEKHLIKISPTSLRGETECQETEKLTTPPAPPTTFTVNPFWGSFCHEGRWEQPFSGALIPAAQGSVPCSYVTRLCSLNL